MVFDIFLENLEYRGRLGSVLFLGRGGEMDSGGVGLGSGVVFSGVLKVCEIWGLEVIFKVRMLVWDLVFNSFY